MVLSIGDMTRLRQQVVAVWVVYTTLADVERNVVMATRERMTWPTWREASDKPRSAVETCTSTDTTKVVRESIHCRAHSNPIKLDYYAAYLAS